MDPDEIGRALARYIKDQTGATRVDVIEFYRLSGGAIQSNYALTVDCAGGHRPGRLELVVRSDSPSQIDFSLTREQEFRVLSVAHEAAVTVPQPLYLCMDESIMGHVFSVMTRVKGAADARKLVRGGLTPCQADSLTRRLGLELARLHQIQPPDTRLDFLPVPGQSPALARVQEYRRALGAIPEPHPALELSLNWLQDHAPEKYDITLCHGDFRTGNYMVDDGQLTGILDWEFAAWNDPYEDLGWICSKSWRFGANAKAVGGVGDKETFFNSYSSLSGRLVDSGKVLYWEVMGMTRWAIIALQQTRRYLSGEQLSLELALTGRLLPEIEFDLLTQIDELESGHE
ncbi:phosphotransferase family protein [Paralcaligenes ureilyticus]|uniref:Aminoglycoside phosphotransferase (APT) family kinase protein n=1 Tax=Paralcaligenes ureilyticus TaxID=627131 RepID=A0A4V2UZ97_9BURK|nr:phosphotransferase family protein [Paralcaligenes ureilyticus]TCT10458.1 aminoglycoside phosphotransferase (APT) family kinase protein [Paralcaligenes ureilyticus]